MFSKREENKTSIITQCGTIDGDPFVDLLESKLDLEVVKVEKNVLKIDRANIYNFDLLRAELKSLSERTLGSRMFTLSTQDDLVVIEFNHFRKMTDSINSLFCLKTCRGLDLLFLNVIREMENAFLNKTNIKLLSIGCGEPTRELNSLYQFLTIYFPDKNFSYTGVDISQSSLSRSKYHDRVGNIQIKLVPLDARDIESLTQLCGKVDFIIMSHPEVKHGSYFASAVINEGVPKLLADNGSLVILNHVQSEADDLLDDTIHNFSLFGNIINLGKLCTLDEASGLDEIGLYFGNYKTPKMLDKITLRF